jgi:hypothetical protein
MPGPTPEQSARSTAAKNRIPQRWADPLQHVDSDEGVARNAFGGDPKDIIEELNSLLVA